MVIFVLIFAGQINGPETIAPYKLARFTVADPSATRVFWIVDGETLAHRPDGLQIGAREYVVTGPPGKYRVRALVVGKDAASDAQYERFFTIGSTPGPGPTPPPDPGPGPSPNPPTPTPVPTVYGLAKIITNSASSLTAAAKARAPELVKQFRGVEASLAAGRKAVQKDFEDAFKVGAGDQVTAWAPVKSAVFGEVQKHYLAGKLKTLAEWKQAVAEIIAGLEAIK